MENEKNTYGVSKNNCKQLQIDNSVKFISAREWEFKYKRTKAFLYKKKKILRDAIQTWVYDPKLYFLSSPSSKWKQIFPTIVHYPHTGSIVRHRESGHKKVNNTRNDSETDERIKLNQYRSGKKTDRKLNISSERKIMFQNQNLINAQN